jgi:hypothetical protein
MSAARKRLSEVNFRRVSETKTALDNVARNAERGQVVEPEFVSLGIQRSEVPVNERRQAVLSLLRRERPAAVIAHRYGVAEATSTSVQSHRTSLSPLQTELGLSGSLIAEMPVHALDHRHKGSTPCS